MDTNEKLTVICFDKKNEKVIGPLKCVQTVVARGKINKTLKLK